METKKLYRIPADGMLAGVCAGLGEYLTLDATIVRLIFVLLFLTGSAGFWIYLIMMIVVPVKPLNG
jgi:phage shock protein C